MPGLAVFGAQWGDEGKGRFVDFLAQEADMVVRYQGGNNAGHTVEVDGVEYKLHLVPSGVLFPGKCCVIGNGVVIDPVSMLEEIDSLGERGIKADNLFVSDRAHVVMPYHKLLDALDEASLGSKEIGTTKKGIGPCYVDKFDRLGIRICDLIQPDVFAEKLKFALETKNRLITKIYGGEPLSFDEIYEQYSACAKRIAPMVTDTSLMVYDACRAGKKVLFEGAQGTLLDIDFGTYPYVTSSHPLPSGIPAGVGIGPTMIDKVVGVAKAYTTRVGKGPFITELEDETGEAIRQKGHEFGATTGRPRRCGWLDLVILRFAVRVGGIDSLAVTRMDTLGGFDKVQVCEAYMIDGKRVENYPASLETLAKAQPVYCEFEGWPDDISHIRRFEDLPAAARKYISFIETVCGVPVTMIGVGPAREQCIVREKVF